VLIIHDLEREPSHAIIKPPTQEATKFLVRSKTPSTLIQVSPPKTRHSNSMKEPIEIRKFREYLSELFSWSWKRPYDRQPSSVVKCVCSRIQQASLWTFNSLTPELNPYAQRCLARFLLGILLLEPCISLKYAWKTNKSNNYLFSLLIMWGSSYIFRHYIAILRERF
jgi:hypothetical protein